MCYNDKVTDKNRAFDAVGCVRFGLLGGCGFVGDKTLRRVRR